MIPAWIVLIGSQSVTDGRTDGRTDGHLCDSICCRSVKSTNGAKKSRTPYAGSSPGPVKNSRHATIFKFQLRERLVRQDNREYKSEHRKNWRKVIEWGKESRSGYATDTWHTHNTTLA